MRDGESLVKVEMANIRPALGWRRQSDHGVEVCTVEVDLSTVAVDDLACLLDLQATRNKQFASSLVKCVSFDYERVLGGKRLQLTVSSKTP